MGLWMFCCWAVWGGRRKSSYKFVFFLRADFESLTLVLTTSFHDIYCRFKFRNQKLLFSPSEKLNCLQSVTWLGCTLNIIFSST